MSATLAAMVDSADRRAPTRGHKKKQRTRAQLIAAAIDVIATQGEVFSIGDITARAGMSHGTFYNYFDDRDALIAAVVPEVLTAFAVESAALVDARGPGSRVSPRSRHWPSQRAADAPDATRLLLRLDAVHAAIGQSQAFDELRADIAVGAASGRFSVDADRPTIDVVVGAMLFAARRIVDGDDGEDYRHAVVAQLLRSLGIDSHEAHDLAQEAVALARNTAPQDRIDT